MTGVLRTAACLGIGEELLVGGRLDRNSVAVAETLAALGLEVVEKAVVGDDEERIASVLSRLLEGADVVVTTGGLGPTADDVTREGIARALGRGLEEREELVAELERRYRSVGREMPDIARRMARVVEGSEPLLNPAGAAPGVFVEWRGRVVAALPGVPHEMRAMLEREVVPRLRPRASGEARLSRTVVVGGLPESRVERMIAPLYERFGRRWITVLCGPALVRVELSARGPREAAARRLEAMVAAALEVLGRHVLGVDVAGPAEVVLERLAARGQTVATAESCTGGLLGGALTEVPGASRVYLGGVVAYTNEAKVRDLGVPGKTLEEKGAVSREVAVAMAEGVRRRLGADWGIGVTGIAGPGGGTADKPVGLVHWAVAGPVGTHARHAVFPGTREHVRRATVNAALDLLRRSLEGEGT